MLFSRARDRIVTFSSMTASDIKADESSNPGRYIFKKWLSFCETGELATGSATAREPDSEFEEMVIEAITALGYTVVPQVGESGIYIDIGVCHDDWPHDFILGVECDGASYHSTVSARERDRHRQMILEERGWVIHRIWSTDWFNNRKGEIRLLEKRLEECLEKKISEGHDKTDSKGVCPGWKKSGESSVPTTAELESQARRNSRSEKSRSAFGESASGNPQQLAIQIVEAVDNAESNDTKTNLLAGSSSGASERSDQLQTTSTLTQFVECGDLVSIRFLDGQQEHVSYRIVEGMSDLGLKRINEETPLAKCLLGAGMGETVEFNHGGRRRALIVEAIQA